MVNPFNKRLDWSFRGKRAVVIDDRAVYCGWVSRIHHQNSSVILHDATIITGDIEVGSVYLRSVDNLIVIEPQMKIEYVELDKLKPSPHHGLHFEAKDDIIRMAYRDKWAGSFPIVRDNYEIINGHKRLYAAVKAGLTHHPVEIIEVTDKQAEELFRIAHDDENE